VEKVGAPGITRVDVRIIAATNRNLEAMVEDGQFRQDLYYRLAVIPLRLPPLRERTGDVPELVEHFFIKAKNTQGRPDLVLHPSFLPYFSSYRWPGNVRELENVVERIVVLASGDEITLADLPDFLKRERTGAEALHIDLPPHGIGLEVVEKELIVRALEKFNWNQTQAARYLDISRKTLIYRMEKFGLRKDSSEEVAQ
jgi:two-component system NtrC family response regulator